MAALTEAREHAKIMPGRQPRVAEEAACDD